MTAVWQSLIPETPSTEPIAAASNDDDDDDLTAVITSSSAVAGPHLHPHYLQAPNHYSTAHHDGPGSSSLGSTLASGTGTHFRAAQTATGNHQCQSNSTSKCRGITNRLASGSTGNSFGAQFWRFYSDRTQKRKNLDKRKRLFLKGGEWNTHQVNVFEKGQRYIGDIFTTLVDAQWRWTLFVFSFSYFSSWIIFAVIWWIILTAHGDFDHFGEPNWTPCVMEVKNFASVFLFSVETQHTIGYGHHRMTDDCAEAIFTLCIQSIAGVLIEAFMVGVVFAKLSRPKKRSETLAFSQNAVICQRDGRLYLMFRVGDLRNRSHIFEAHVRSQVITTKVTPEGEVIPIHQEEIKVGGYGEDEDRILLFWPTLILHPIDVESPFYSMSPNDLLKAKLEVLVVMEGVVESTGMTTQARTSYLPSEIRWGHRFQNMAAYKSELGQHVIDFDLFNSTFPVETPLCSARDLDDLRGLKSEGLSGGRRQLLTSSLNENEETASVSIHDDGSNCNNNNHRNSNSCNSSNCSLRDNINEKRPQPALVNNHNHNIELSLLNSVLLNHDNEPSSLFQDELATRIDMITTTTCACAAAGDKASAPVVPVDDDDDDDEDDVDELMIQEEALIESDVESHNHNHMADDHHHDHQEHYVDHPRITNCSLKSSNNKSNKTNNSTANNDHNGSRRRRLNSHSSFDSINSGSIV